MARLKFVGFYWTLPVPWAGFTKLSENVDEAAAQSRTIRYQRNAVRRWVAEESGDLIAEQVFLELAPDHATPYVEAPLQAAIELCRKQDATFVYVDFQERHEARPHRFLRDRLDAAKIPSMALPPEPEAPSAGGENFDPIDHFRIWRAAYKEHLEAKPEKAMHIMQAILRLREEGNSWPAVADWLNGQDIKTLNGKPWSGDNARKFSG
jgi:hypothetical protein